MGYVFLYLDMKKEQLIDCVMTQGLNFKLNFAYWI
jgi:hypothetical protein